MQGAASSQGERSQFRTPATFLPRWRVGLSKGLQTPLAIVEQARPLTQGSAGQGQPGVFPGLAAALIDQADIDLPACAPPWAVQLLWVLGQRQEMVNLIVCQCGAQAGGVPIDGIKRRTRKVGLPVNRENAAAIGPALNFPAQEMEELGSYRFGIDEEEKRATMSLAQPRPGRIQESGWRQEAIVLRQWGQGAR